MDYLNISILIITYNQQDVIGRAIDSILAQKDYGLHEIVICDDGSSDDNWEVINKYKAQYPGIIRCYQNNPNLGIYDNAQKVVGLRGTSDLFYLMAGDDELCDGWFHSIQDYIARNKIDVKHNAVVFYSDWERMSPQGKSEIVTQELVLSGIDVMRLRLRGKIGVRSILVSEAVLQKYTHIDTSNGIPYAETFFESQPMLYAEQSYYCPVVASRYYSGIGFSTKTHTQEYYQQVLYNYEQMLHAFPVSKKDYCFIKFAECKTRFSIKSDLKSFAKALFYGLLSHDSELGPSFKHYFLTYGSMLKRLFKH